jgi:head-tail adaptor
MATASLAGRAVALAAGDLRHLIDLEGPVGPPRPDGSGGYVTDFAPLDPSPVWASIERARLRPTGMESREADTAISLADRVVTMRYHAGVTTKTRITYRGRRLQVLGVENADEASIATITYCAEIVA